MTPIMLLIVTVLAAAVQAMAGFGFALLVVPFLVLTHEAGSAVQTATLVTLATSIIMLPALVRYIDKKVLSLLLLGCLPGFPVGWWLLNSATVSGIQLAVAVVILFTVAFPRVLPRSAAARPGDVTGAFLTGLAAGTLTTALAMPGPPIAVYLRHLGMKKDPSRALIFAVFAIVYCAAFLFQWIWHGIAAETWRTTSILLPAAIAGTLFGKRFSGLINERLFRQCITGILVVTALYLLLTNMG